LVLSADHGSGIEKVSFSLDGGTWSDVTTPSVTTVLNKSFGGWVTTIDTSLLMDGWHEVRAIVYPMSSDSEARVRVCQDDPDEPYKTRSICSWRFYSNYHNSLNVKNTILIQHPETMQQEREVQKLHGHP
jgi:hypothetical protein